MKSALPLAAKGINVIGHLGSSAGLGKTARLFIDILVLKGFTVAAMEIDAYDTSEASDNENFLRVESVAQLPYDRNLIIVSIDRLPKLWLSKLPALLNPRFRNAGMIFWELPAVPVPWLPSLKLFDAIVACSHYVRQTIETEIPELPTVYAEHPLARETYDKERQSIRTRFDIPTDKTIFCCSFDPRSGLARKNPSGAIAAWFMAFPTDPEVRLLVKSNGEISAGPLAPDLRAVVERARNDPRVQIISDRLSNREVMGLFDCCDVFISLHRSEGLGLVPLEAMSLGKLVVATGYSGTMTYMTEQNSMLVAYRLIEPVGDTTFIGRGFAGTKALWADPDLDHAAKLLRLAADNPVLRAQLGRQAGEDIGRRQSTAWSGEFLQHLLDHLDKSDRHASRRGLRWRILLNEIINPTLRRRNIAAILRRLKR